MATYKISNRISGLELGTYKGATIEDALDTLARNDRYRDYVDACEEDGEGENNLIIVKKSDLIIVKICEAYRAAADGHAGEQVLGGDNDGDIIAVGSIDDCRAEISNRIGADAMPKMRWAGTDGDIEAYYDSDDEGCGGYHIRPVSE